MHGLVAERSVSAVAHRGLRSLAQGITSEMINQLPDNEVQNVTQNLSDDPKWLSRRLVCMCTLCHA